MSEINVNAKTTPKTTMKTELWVSTSKDFTSPKQIFMVQEIPVFDPAKEPVNYGCLESSSEFQTEGTKKAETLTIPILYVEAQHKELKEYETNNTQLYFRVKLPDTTAESGSQPQCAEFGGTISLALDTLTQGDNMIQENMTVFKNTTVTWKTWTPVASL